MRHCSPRCRRAPVRNLQCKHSANTVQTGSCGPITIIHPGSKNQPSFVPGPRVVLNEELSPRTCHPSPQPGNLRASLSTPLSPRRLIPDRQLEQPSLRCACGLSSTSLPPASRLLRLTLDNPASSSLGRLLRNLQRSNVSSFKHDKSAWHAHRPTVVGLRGALPSTPSHPTPRLDSSLASFTSLIGTYCP